MFPDVHKPFTLFKKDYGLTLLVLVLGAVALALLVIFRPTPAPRSEKPASLPVVNVVSVSPGRQSLVIFTQGTVTPRREINLVAQVAGEVSHVNRRFINGGFFKAGEDILHIDPSDYQFAVSQATAQLKEAQQLRAIERGQSRQARREWRELESQEANDLFLRKPQLAAAEASVEAAQAQLEQARLNLRRTRIRSPFNGRVRAADVNLGQYVNVGTVLGRIYDTDVAEIRLPLTDHQLALIDLPLGFQVGDGSQGPRVTVHGVIASQSYQWDGQIVRTEASLDTRTRLYYAVAEVKNPFLTDEDSNRPPLVIGLFVEAAIEGRPLDDLVKLPASALFKGDHIFVLDEKHYTVLKPVTVLKRDADHVWVQAALQADQLVVVNHQHYLSAGIKVSPVTPQAAKKPKKVRTSQETKDITP